MKSKEENKLAKSKPLILDFAIERKKISSVKIEYDYLKSMSFVKINDISHPFIETKHSNIELLTKTKVHQERDDEEINFLELQTKTFISQERDDEDFNYNQ